VRWAWKHKLGLQDLVDYAIYVHCVCVYGDTGCHDIDKLYILPWKAASICSEVGCGLVRSNVYMDMTNPGVQNPHCEPCEPAIDSCILIIVNIQFSISALGIILVHLFHLFACRHAFASRAILRYGRVGLGRIIETITLYRVVQKLQHFIIVTAVSILSPFFLEFLSVTHYGKFATRLEDELKIAILCRGMDSKLSLPRQRP